MELDPTPLEAVSLRAFRALLRIYPRSFRDEFGTDSLLLFRDRLRAAYHERGLLGLALHWMRTVPNVLWHGTLERLSAHPRRGSSPDPRYAVRSLLRDPGLLAVGTLSLAIGIGASTALFSLLEGVLLQPLPFPEPDRLVQLWEVNPELDLSEEGPSPLNVADWTDLTTSLDGIAAWYLTSGTHRDERGAEEVRGAQVTPGFFRVMGWDAALGRTPVEEEVNRYGPVVLSDRLWRRRYGANPAIVGSFLTISGRQYEVVGVMPPAFSFPDPSVELWMAWDLRDVYADNAESRTWRFLRAVGRMSPGASMESVQAEMESIADGLAQRYPEADRGWSVRVRSLHEQIVGDVRPPLLAAFGAVALILVMACVNVGTLLLARAPARSRELAVRRALGATSAHTAGQLLLENVLLAAAGGAVGLVVAWGLVRLLVRFDAGGIPRLQGVSIDPWVLAFATGISLLAAVGFGLAPILQATRTPPAEALRGGDRHTGSVPAARLRRGLVSSQIALALVLLAAAALFSRSFLGVRAIDPGFDARNVLSFRVSLDPQGEGEGYVASYYDGLLQRLAEIPGVRGIGAVQTLPLNPVGNDFTRPYRAAGTGTPTAEAPAVQMRIATPGYFRTMGMDFLAGGGFSGDESADAPLVAVVNRTLAARLWPDRSAVGETLELDFRDGWQPYRVLGVVEDTRAYGLRSDPRPEIYLPHRQSPYLAMTVVLKTDPSARVLPRSIEDVVRSYGPSQPVHNFVTLEQLLGDATATERFLVFLMTAFGSIALVLACSGVFGVMAYMVGQRRKELGLRAALGAGRLALIRYVLGAASVLAASGVGAGLVAAVSLGATVRSQLYGVSPWDPLTLALATVVLFAAALAAAVVPAGRAVRVDPASVLRSD